MNLNIRENKLYELWEFEISKFSNKSASRSKNSYKQSYRITYERNIHISDQPTSSDKTWSTGSVILINKHK